MIQAEPVTPSELTDLPIRSLALNDLRHCADLSEDRGWLREDHKWGLLLVAGDGYGIDAPDGNGLAAVCVVTRYGRPHADPELAAIGMVLVADRYARQGMGRRLMTYICNDVLKGIPLTLHATPFGRPLYEELGFDAIGSAEMLQGSFQPDPAPPGSEAALVRPATADDIARIVGLDTEVFGTDRTHLLTRLPAFADRLFVAEESTGELIGYAAIWPNMETHVIGPLVAQDTATARALVNALAATTDRPLRTDVDVRHEGLIAWLKARGLGSLAVNAVMTRDISRLPGDWKRRWAPITVAAS
ncbi:MULTISPECIES: GNAT family N-acetyltransferase [unclassified Streptomyces]|uniref:GNAT family N-acetyltransferase n=1 Tax=unclassified Streptomyces TaxID=2593676 RepID=UPI002E2F6947|nr:MULTISPECIES: GNAT family N-acetyltransferase [unclassified Streptomyces]WUC65576.1 GNAT family N-acetyltransferase [Streptomyces sp. NBC_00539]